MPLAVVATHPRYAHLLTPGACCELVPGHAGAHRSGLLVWHEPPLVVVAPQTVAPAKRERDS